MPFICIIHDWHMKNCFLIDSNIQVFQKARIFNPIDLHLGEKSCKSVRIWRIVHTKCRIVLPSCFILVKQYFIILPNCFALKKQCFTFYLKCTHFFMSFIPYIHF